MNFYSKLGLKVGTRYHETEPMRAARPGMLCINTS